MNHPIYDISIFALIIIFGIGIMYELSRLTLPAYTELYPDFATNTPLGPNQIVYEIFWSHKDCAKVIGFKPAAAGDMTDAYLKCQNVATTTQ